MIMVLFGPPGCGKGTQAAIIAKDIDIPHLSTGDMLRDAVKSETETGLKAASIMEEGKLVSDEIVIDIIKDRICNNDCKNGFILDGFPRTVSQAKELDFMLTSENMKLDIVVDFSVNDEAIKECYGVGNLKSKRMPLIPVSYTHLTLPTNREV